MSSMTYARFCRICERRIQDERRRRRNGRIADFVVLWTLRLFVLALFIGPLVVSLL